jgi:hypothetical protein
MATTLRRSKSANIAPSVVAKVHTFLDSLPVKPKEQLSLREAVSQLQPQIQEALSKGYSYQDVADMLAKQSITISASTLKNYVPSGRRKSAKAAVKAPRTPRAKAAEAAAPATTVTKTSTRGRRAAAAAEPAAAPKRPGRKPAAAAAAPAPKATRGRKKSV